MRSPDVGTDSNAALLQIGREALHVLEVREQAAKIEAARLELQAILAAAEAGRPERLRRWLEQHRDLVSMEDLEAIDGWSGTEASELSRVYSGFRPIPPPVGPFALPASLRSPASADRSLGAEQGVASDPAAPAGKHGDEAALKSPEDPKQQGESVERLGQPGSAGEPAAAGKSPGVTLPRDAQAEAKQAASRLDASPPKEIRGSDATADKSSAKASPATSPAAKLPAAKAATAPPATANTSPAKPAAGKSKVDLAQLTGGEQKQEALRRRSTRWLTSSLGVSLVVHLVLTIALAVAVFTISQPPKPLEIVSDPVEASEPLDAPIELHEQSELELTEVSNTLPAPAIASSFDSIAATDVAIGETSLGPMLSDVPSDLGSTVGNAAGVVGGVGEMTGAVEFFGAVAAGNTFCYVVDNSPSMRRDGAFDRARGELMRSVSSLKPSQRFFVSFFGKEIGPMELEEGNAPSEYPVYATPENLEKLFKWVQTVDIQNEGWPPNNALEQAIEMEPDAIFLLFDGDTRVDVAEFLREANRVEDLIGGERVRVPIHTIGFYTQAFEKLMKQIAEENEGNYRFVPKPPKQPGAKRNR